MQAPECIEEASHSKEISAVVLRQCDRTISLERAFRLATSTQELALHHIRQQGLGGVLDVPLVGLKVQGAAQNSKPLLSKEVDIPDHISV
jgi:hypothetical protein